MGKHLLRVVDDAAAAVEDQLLWLSHAVIVVLVLLAVVFRYFVGDPLVWTEEFVIIVFSWMLFLGLASGFRRRMHLRIDALLIVMPAAARTVLGVLATATTLATLGGLVWFGTSQALSLADAQTPMMRISAAWAVTALPVGAVLGCLHIVRHAVCDGIGQTLWPSDLVAAVVAGESS